MEPVQLPWQPRTGHLPGSVMFSHQLLHWEERGRSPDHTDWCSITREPFTNLWPMWIHRWSKCSWKPCRRALHCTYTVSAVSHTPKCFLPFFWSIMSLKKRLFYSWTFSEPSCFSASFSDLTHVTLCGVHA